MFDIVSWLPAELVFEKGLPEIAIVGRLKTNLAAGGHLTATNFVENRVFVSHLHKFIARHIQEDSSAVQAAEELREGNLYVIDGRTPDPSGVVPPEDILGSVAISDGRILPDSYNQNPNHRLFTESGFFVLSSPLWSALEEDLRCACLPFGAGD